MQLESPYKLELILNFVRFEARFLLTHFYEFSQNVVAFSAVTGQLVIIVSLKDISSGLN